MGLSEPGIDTVKRCNLRILETLEAVGQDLIGDILVEHRTTHRIVSDFISSVSGAAKANYLPDFKGDLPTGRLTAVVKDVPMTQSEVKKEDKPIVTI